MKKFSKKVSVDSGLIVICDMFHYKNYNFKRNPTLVHMVEIPIGLYNMEWKVLNTWNGDIEGDNFLKVITGKILVGDPCYSIENKNTWDLWLEDTYYGKHPPEGCIVIDKMGGDGIFYVEFKLKKI